MANPAELEAQLEEERQRMKLLQDEIARLKTELAQPAPSPTPVRASPSPSSPGPPGGTRAPANSLASPGAASNAVARPSQSSPASVGQSPSAPVKTNGFVVSQGSSSPTISQDQPASPHRMSASPQFGGSPQAGRSSLGAADSPKRTVVRPPPPGAQPSSQPASQTPPMSPQQYYQSQGRSMSVASFPSNAVSPTPTSLSSSLARSQSSAHTPSFVRSPTMPTAVPRGSSDMGTPPKAVGFSAASLLNDNRDRSNSVEMIPQRKSSVGPLEHNVVITPSQSPPPMMGSPTNPRPKLGSALPKPMNFGRAMSTDVSLLPSHDASPKSGPNISTSSPAAPPSPGPVQHSPPGILKRSTSSGNVSTAAISSPAAVGFSASSLGTASPQQGSNGGGNGGGGYGFTASSLISSFQFDESEMLKGPAPKSGGFTLSASMLGPSSGGGEDGGLIGGPALQPLGSVATIGLLPSATPKMTEGGAVEKVLDRVEDDLVYFSKNFQIILKGGTITKVIERLTAESQADNSVVDTFLLTYRKFISPELLLEELMKRYNLSSEDAPSDNALKVVRLRVGNFIKRWLSEHFQDFRGNEMLIDRLAAMAKQTFLVNEKSLGEKILSTLEEQRQRLVDANIGRASNKTTRSDHPDPILPKSMNFNDFDAIELARQLSLYEQSIYKQIHPKECLDQCWSKKDRYSRAPNVMRLIDLFNQCASWVASTIVRQNKLEDRVREVKRFMRVAIELRRLNNFNGTQEILAGLSDSSIFRLRATWLKVEKDERLMQEFDEVKKALSPDKSWVIYRGILKEIQPPCIPYLGVYLTDLTFIEDGNSNYLQTTDSRSDIINFEKCRKQALVIGNILLYQQDSYNFERVDVIYDMFNKGLSIIEDKDALHKMSRTIEPPEMVEEAKRKAAKKAEKEAKKKAEGTPQKKASISLSASSPPLSTPPRSSSGTMTPPPKKQ